MRFIMGDRSMVIHCYYLRGGYRIRPLMYQDMATGDRLIAFELRGIVYLALRPNAYDVIKQGWFSLL